MAIACKILNDQSLIRWKSPTIQNLHSSLSSQTLLLRSSMVRQHDSDENLLPPMERRERRGRQATRRSRSLIGVMRELGSRKSRVRALASYEVYWMEQLKFEFKLMVLVMILIIAVSVVYLVLLGLIMLLMEF